MIKQASAVILVALLFSSEAALADNINGVNINFQEIEYLGNPADTSPEINRNGRGAVNYGYRISQTEISIDQYAASGIGSAGGGNVGYWVAAGSNAPVVDITWHDAARYCNWLTSGNANVGAYVVDGANKVTAITAHSGSAMDSLVTAYGEVYVLPSEDEWYKAAYYTGSGYSKYANGSNLNGDIVQGGEAMFNTNTVWAVGSGLPEQNGTVNMMGNVWEWQEDGFSNAFPTYAALRGGSFATSEVSLRSESRGFQQYEANDFRVGFRVTAIPEPGTISLMSLSTMGLFATRTIRRRKSLGKSLIPIGREYLCDTFDERDAAFGTDTPDYLAELMRMAQGRLILVWDTIHAQYKKLDKVFWNRMVMSYERRVGRKVAFKKALKEKSINCLDAILALIMK